jgi:hypothetical protein
MSFKIKYKEQIIYRGEGNYSSILKAHHHLPRDIRKILLDENLKNSDLIIENSNIPFKELHTDVCLVKSKSATTRSKTNKKYYNKIKNNKIMCECGSLVLKVSYKRHLKTQKHKELSGFSSCDEN